MRGATARTALATVLLSALPLTATVGTAQADSAAARPVMPRHNLTVYPTRLVNAYFRELPVGYRYRPAGLPRWGLEVLAGPSLRSSRRYRDREPLVWGFGYGAELRYDWFAARRAWAPYAFAGLEASRVYYRARRGLEPVPGTDYGRVVEARVIARRQELLLGIGVERAWASGFSADLRLGVGPGRYGWFVPSGAAPLQPFEPHFEQPYPIGDGRSWKRYPSARLRLGLGYTW